MAVSLDVHQVLTLQNQNQKDVEPHLIRLVLFPPE